MRAGFFFGPNLDLQKIIFHRKLADVYGIGSALALTSDFLIGAMLILLLPETRGA